jgi:hypothetical protein
MRQPGAEYRRVVFNYAPATLPAPVFASGIG